jgi:hypothetical protein
MYMVLISMSGATHTQIQIFLLNARNKSGWQTVGRTKAWRIERVSGSSLLFLWEELLSCCLQSFYILSLQLLTGTRLRRTDQKKLGRREEGRGRGRVVSSFFRKAATRGPPFPLCVTKQFVCPLKILEKKGSSSSSSNVEKEERGNRKIR